MAAMGQQKLGHEMNDPLEADGGIKVLDSGHNRGGWITFPFMMATLFCLTLASWGWLINLVVYLIEEFNVKRITAAQVSNVVYGCISLFPVLGAIVSDSFVGSFVVISVSSFVSLLGICLLVLTSSLDSLRPQDCETGSILCRTPTKAQFTVLYTAVALACVGSGGTRFTLSTAGANQFDKQKEQTVYFGWFFFVTYVASVLGATVIAYVEDSISWRAGFGISFVANLVGCLIFLLGKRFYRHDKPQGSPFTGLVRVVVSSIRKRKVLLSSRKEDYYYNLNQTSKGRTTEPTKNLRFLNRAALLTEGDTQPDGSIAKPWRLCTVQQVEDLKCLLKILPIWSTSIFLATPAAIQLNLTVLQALAMDRHLGSHFRIPAGSMQVVLLLSTCITLTPIDKIILPLSHKLTRRAPTLLQRIGVGHVFGILSMAVSAIVESKRLKLVHDLNLQNQPNSVAPMLALWLFPQLILVGISEAFSFPGNVAFFYREFPLALRSTATSVTSLIIGIAFYLCAALIDLAQRETHWLPDDINLGRMDYLYWTLAVIAVLNFGYFIVCACFYKYRDLSEPENEVSSAKE